MKYTIGKEGNIMNRHIAKRLRSPLASSWAYSLSFISISRSVGYIALEYQNMNRANANRINPNDIANPASHFVDDTCKNTVHIIAQKTKNSTILSLNENISLTSTAMTV